MSFEIAVSALIGAAMLGALFFTVEARKRSRRRRQHNAGLNRMAAIHGLLAGLSAPEGLTHWMTSDGLMVVIRRLAGCTEVVALRRVERAEGSITTEGTLYRITDDGCGLCATLSREVKPLSETFETDQPLALASSWMLARLERNLQQLQPRLR